MALTLFAPEPEIEFTFGFTSSGVPCVQRFGVCMEDDTAENLLPLLAMWSPALTRQLARALAQLDLAWEQAA